MYSMYECVQKEKSRKNGWFLFCGWEKDCNKVQKKGFFSVHIMMELGEGPLAPDVLSNLRILT